jgi:hypothetical protein
MVANAFKNISDLFVYDPVDGNTKAAGCFMFAEQYNRALKVGVFQKRFCNQQLTPFNPVHKPKLNHLALCNFMEG